MNSAMQELPQAKADAANGETKYAEVSGKWAELKSRLERKTEECESLRRKNVST